MTRVQYTVNDIHTQPPLRKVTPMTDRIAGAQMNATLAIAEQLRIGNLIALGYGGDEADRDQARADARAALVNWHAHEDPEMGGWPEIRPDIAAALGIDGYEPIEEKS